MFLHVSPGLTDSAVTSETIEQSTHRGAHVGGETL